TTLFRSSTLPCAEQAVCTPEHTSSTDLAVPARRRVRYRTDRRKTGADTVLVALDHGGGMDDHQFACAFRECIYVSGGCDSWASFNGSSHGLSLCIHTRVHSRRRLN